MLCVISISTYRLCLKKKKKYKIEVTLNKFISMLWIFIAISFIYIYIKIDRHIYNYTLYIITYCVIYDVFVVDD